jgi:lysyl endopeptidase
MWYYESPGCSNEDVSDPIVTARARVVANNANSDFALLRLVESPNHLTIRYCGWDRSGSTPSSTVCVHHPSGDIKKISFDNNSPAITGYLISGCTPSSGTTHWRVVDWDVGTTEGGSSGSPLFDMNHRIIGQLHGGCAACGNNESDYYGRFSSSWNSSTDSRRRLRDWLDPSNTGTTTLNGLESFNLFPGGCHTTTVQNQTFNSNSNYSDCGISVKNVTVQNGSKLTLDCTSKVLIQGPFQVKSGSQLVIK